MSDLWRTAAGAVVVPPESTALCNTILKVGHRQSVLKRRIHLIYCSVISSIASYQRKRISVCQHYKPGQQGLDMKSIVFYAVCTLLACSVAAHPNFGRRHDLIDDDEPFESAADADFDLVAEESEHFESVVATEAPLSSRSPPVARGRIKFSNNRYSSLNRLRSRKVTTEAPDTTTQESADNVKDERALMLVLPYNAKNMSESKMQELYTKAPITWLINTTTPEPPTTKSEAQTQRTSTTVVVTPTPEVKYYRKRITTTTTTTPPPPIREDIKDVLASIGLFPDGKGSANWRPITTTTTPTPEFVKIATEGFSPDMVNLLTQFGLMPSDSKHNEIPPPQVEEEPIEEYDLPQSQPAFQPEIDPSSYSVFKPIPNQQPLSSDMKEFLASFGIVDDDNIKRPRGKQLNQDVTPSPTNIPTLHPESMSEEMKDILHSLGLTPDQNTEKSILQSRSINSEYIFNPTDSVQNSLNSTEDVENLKKLLQAFKSLASNTSSPEEIEKQLQEANLSQQNFTNIFGYHGNENDKHSMTLDKYTNAPDPLSFEELLYAINETKNEIFKRQEAKNTSSGYDKSTPDIPFELPSTSEQTSSTAKATSTTTASTTTEEEENDSKSAASDTQAEESAESTTPNNAALLADLESSFGGSTSNEPVDDTLPPPKPNGFYFMLDWNSFLNVGEDDKGVNLKFAPRLGNSRNFLPITVP